MKPIVGSIVALVTPMAEDGSVDYAALHAEIHQGVLLVTLPKRLPAEAGVRARHVA